LAYYNFSLKKNDVHVEGKESDSRFLGYLMDELANGGSDSVVDEFIVFFNSKNNEINADVSAQSSSSSQTAISSNNENHHKSRHKIVLKLERHNFAKFKDFVEHHKTEKLIDLHNFKFLNDKNQLDAIKKISYSLQESDTNHIPTPKSIEYTPNEYEIQQAAKWLDSLSENEKQGAKININSKKTGTQNNHSSPFRSVKLAYVKSINDLIKINMPCSLKDLLIITAYYLENSEKINKYPLKRINSKIFKFTQKLIEHSVLQSVILQGLIEVVPDFSRSAEFTEYRLTESGNKYFLENYKTTSGMNNKLI